MRRVWCHGNTTTTNDNNDSLCETFCNHCSTDLSAANVREACVRERHGDEDTSSVNKRHATKKKHIYI